MSKYLKYLNENYFREIGFRTIESKINKKLKNGKIKAQRNRKSNISCL